MIRGFLFLTLFLNFNVSARDMADVAQDKNWLNLLHYRSGIFGFKSEITSKKYFLSENGRSSSLDELYASIEFIFNKTHEGDADSHPACLFPARAIYLSKTLSISLPKVKCPKFEHFKEKMEAKGVALIFSSYFLDTPASAFGHTFLRFLKNPDKEEQFELLDYSLNYAAVVTTSNALIYAIMGLAGGFDGEFASLPHFYKVREYNDHESRDLWSYELNLTNSELEMIIAHAWELGQVPIPYYYLTGNCSYYMLALLDVANPNWKLVENNPYFVLPVDTLKTVAKVPGLIKKIQYRPSKRRVFEKRLESLSQSERNLVAEAFDQNSLAPFAGVSDAHQKAKLLDTFIDFWDYKNSKAITKEDNEILAQKNQFLIARSEIPIKTDTPKVEKPESENPLLGHSSRRLSMGGGYIEDRSAFFDFEFRFALHDFYDNLIGQNPLATMEMGRFRLRFHPDEDKARRQWRIQEALLLNVVSLRDFKEFFRNPSWRFNLGMRTIEDRSCDQCQVAHSSLGAGIAKANDRNIFSFMITAEVDVGIDYGEDDVRIGVGPEFFWRYQNTQHFSVGIFSDYKFRFINDSPKRTWSVGPKSRFYLQDEWSLELTGTKNDKAYQVGSNLLKTF